MNLARAVTMGLMSLTSLGAFSGCGHSEISPKAYEGASGSAESIEAESASTSLRGSTGATGMQGLRHSTEDAPANLEEEAEQLASGPTQTALKGEESVAACAKADYEEWDAEAQNAADCTEPSLVD